MYVNYGDKNFFEYGRLVDSEYSSTVFDILVCDPYLNEDDDNLYWFAECQVDITDDWIDKKAVMSCIGMTDKSYDPILFAVGCIDYYGTADFGGESYACDNHYMTMADIKDILKYRQISLDNLDITW